MLSKRRKLIIIAIIASIFIIIGATVAVALVSSRLSVTLNEKNVTVPVFGKFDQPQAKSELVIFGIPFEVNTEFSGEVDTNKLGEYKTTYTAKFLNKTVSAEGTVTVVDTVAPVINLDHPDFVLDYTGVPPTPEQIAAVFTVTDNYDGDITHTAVKTVEGRVCHITATDSSGNVAQKDVNIVYNDGINPTIMLSGPSTVFVMAGNPYTEMGYYAKDNLDGDITSWVAITEYPDPADPNVYFRQYFVSDAAGNSAKVSRKVIVYGNKTANDYANVQSSGKTVYLTFDDGPGVYTEKLLGYLDRYGVKATFFLTNQFPRYQYVIGEIHNRGHKLAVHTLTHKWSIYDSVDNYMADFNAMRDIIFQQTGVETNLFRFPGGTNNAVSKSHCKGIMTTLTQKMTESGYIYFDWNVDCNDSRYKDSQSVISSTIYQISKKTNAVVLMHDIKDYTVEAVPAIIEYCLQNGYSFGILDENAPLVQNKPVN